jgi:hypothetical protein
MSDTVLLQNVDIHVLYAENSKKMLILEKKLQECSSKMDDIGRQLEQKREEGQRVFDETIMKEETLGAETTAAEQQMQQKSLENPMAMFMKKREEQESLRDQFMEQEEIYTQLVREMEEMERVELTLYHQVQKSEMEIHVPHKRSSKALGEKAAEIKKNIKIQESSSLLSQKYGESTSSIDTGAHSKRDDQH